jgi:hypothetical protein
LCEDDEGQTNDAADDDDFDDDADDNYHQVLIPDPTGAGAGRLVRRRRV